MWGKVFKEGTYLCLLLCAFDPSVWPKLFGKHRMYNWFNRSVKFLSW